MEPADPADIPALVRGLRLLNRADPFVEVLISGSGEHVIGAAGEVHLERCIRDLQVRPGTGFAFETVFGLYGSLRNQLPFHAVNRNGASADKPPGGINMKGWFPECTVTALWKGQENFIAQEAQLSTFC